MTQRQIRERGPVAVIAPGVNGHRLFYARLVAERALASGREVRLLIPPGGSDSPEFHLHLGELATLISVHELDDFAYPAVALDARVRGCQLVALEGDGWLLHSLLRPRKASLSASLLIMRPTGQGSSRLTRDTRSALKALLRWAARRRHISVFRLVDSNRTSVGRWGVTDPVVFSGNRALARTNRERWKGLRAADVDVWIGVVGALNHRKNIGTVASAIALLEERRIGLVLAGRVASDEEGCVEEWLLPARAAGVPVVRDERLLTDVELDSTILALDCVVLAHSNEGPSGVFGKARAAGTRIVAAGAHSLKLAVNSVGSVSGVVWTELTAESIASGLRQVLDAARPQPELEREVDFAQKLLGGR